MAVEMGYRCVCLEVLYAETALIGLLCCLGIGLVFEDSYLSESF